MHNTRRAMAQHTLRKTPVTRMPHNNKGRMRFKDGYSNREAFTTHESKPKQMPIPFMDTVSIYVRHMYYGKLHVYLWATKCRAFTVTSDLCRKGTVPTQSLAHLNSHFAAFVYFRYNLKIVWWFTVGGWYVLSTSHGFCWSVRTMYIWPYNWNVMTGKHVA